MPITIHTQESSPTQIYAHQCWQTNPQISPDYWHEAQGHTLSRIALNWQTAVTQPELLTQSVNLILCTSATLAATQHAIATSGHPPASFVIACLIPLPNLPTFTLPSLTSPLIPILYLTESNPKNTPTYLNLALETLEEMVKKGHIDAYGIADSNIINPNPPIPLHQWLEMAAISAQKIWSRPKRPSLRWMVAPLDLLNLNLLTSKNTQHKQELVTPLELAARLHLAVIGVPQTMPEAPSPSPTALHALTKFAQAEQKLNHDLGGWPTIQNQPLFSVLAHLAQGQTPWPTPTHWQHWQTETLPFLINYLNINHPTLSPSLTAAAQALLPHGPSLVNAAAQPLLATVINQLSLNFPISWAGQGAATQAAMLLTSLPALTALALTPLINLNPLQKLPKHPNPSFLLQTP